MTGFSSYFTVLLALLVSFQGYSQQLSTTNKKAIKLYDESRNLVRMRQFDQAIENLHAAVRKDPSFAEAYLRLAGIYKNLNDQESANQNYLMVAKLYPDSRRYSSVYLYLGAYYFSIGEYADAKGNLELYLKYKTSADKNLRTATTMLRNCEFALTNMSNGFEFNPRPLNNIVNQHDMQYFPVLTVDQKTLIFVVRGHDEEIVVSNFENGDWGLPRILSDNISSEFNEGTCSISADGRMLVFTSCMGRPGFGSCDLFISTKQGETWSEPVNMGRAINSSAWDSQPSLSADGRTLYFVSNRKGGLGLRDIWVSRKNNDDEWGKAVNLGPSINTREDDISPFIHPNGQRLYFAANGRLGFGGFDIYFAGKTSSGAWQDITNFGFPINTHDDEVAMFISADGKKGYYSHEEVMDSKRTSKLYEIDIPPSLQVSHKSSFITGTVSDKESNDPLEGNVKLFDLESNEVVGWVKSDSVNGQYYMVLTEGAEYALYVDAPGYLFNSFYFDYLTDTNQVQAISADIKLSKIKPGAYTVLNNVFFDFDKYDLTPKSKTELLKVVDFLKSNKGLKIQIAGNTDNIGNESYNLKLSTQRARSVYDYLIQAGIKQASISYKGFGSDFPVSDNATEAGRSKNRRIEFSVL